MFKYDKVYLGNRAKDLGFNRDTLEKVTRLYDILRFINTMPFLKNNLALKGGTAINFTMLELPRLSIDIDLDFVNPCSKEEMLQQRRIINEAISRYMLSEGYEINPKSKFPHSLDSFVYRYIGVSGNYDNIKIEINYSLRTHIDKTEYVDAIHPYFSNDFKIHRLSIIEIFASKINALLTRTAARDLYDVHKMIQNKLIDNLYLNHLRKSVILYFAVSSKILDQAFDLKKINHINESMIKRDLLPVLSKNDNFNLVDAKEVVNKYLSQLLVLTTYELEFIDCFRKNNYNPSLLFDDNQILNRVNNHPMAIWRVNRLDK